MTHILVFNLMLLASVCYAMWRGGAPERAVAFVFAIAATASYAAPYRHFHAVEPFLLAIDLAALVALTGIALRANRFWPLYESALQLLTVAIHGVKAYQPDFAYWMYNGVAGKLAYPTLILLVAGTLRHRQRLASMGSDRAWSSL